MIEWYLNGQRGLEHGSTIAAPLLGDADRRLVLPLAVDAPVTAHLTDCGCEDVTIGACERIRYYLVVPFSSLRV